MDCPNDITDEEFIPFLHNLGVETYKKAFEWMLQDPGYADALKWLYRNLDHNNALSAREEYRYKELEKTKCLLPLDELETSIVSLQEQYEGLCLPGDQESIEDMKLNISMQKDRLAMLEKHEGIMNDLIKDNHMAKEDLDIVLTKLSASQQQFADNETALGEQCLSLADEVDTIVNDVCDMIADNMKMSYSVDKKRSNKFYAFGPFEEYKHSQQMFMSNFDLYVSQRLNNKHLNAATDQYLQTVYEATNIEKKLSNSICAYISTQAGLCSEQAKLEVVSNCYDVHPSRITAHSLKKLNLVEILEQEETIIDQQIKEAAVQFVAWRTNLAVATAAQSALAIREQIYSALEYLLETTQHALALDKLLYCTLRNELCSIEELLHFASHLRQHLINESEAIRNRIESMNEICAEQELAGQRLQSSNILEDILHSLLGAERSDDAASLARRHSQLRNAVRELSENVAEGFENRERAIDAYKDSSKPIQKYIWDGSTNQPNCNDTLAIRLLHQLTEVMARVDGRVSELSDRYNTERKGDKQNFRKLWQWFLTDPSKLLSGIKSGQSRGYM